MKIEVDVLFPGFSGKLGDYSLGWGTFALIRREDRNILFDAGGPAVRTKVGEILKAHDLDICDIDTVVLSHLHNDHTFNIDLFPHALFVLSRAEWEYATAIPRTDYFIDEMALSLLRVCNTILVESDGEEIIPGVSTLMTPGHTPGSMSVVVDRGDEKWILTGDAVKNRGELRSGEVMMSLSPKDTKRSIETIRSGFDRVLPGHDGWLRIEKGEIIPEGGNDKTIVFGQGVTINGGKTEIVLHMD